MLQDGPPQVPDSYRYVAVTALNAPESVRFGILVLLKHTVIQVSGIRKTYGKVVAVDEVSFNVAEGEIFGLIGPNGAGKTTTMECVEGLRTPDRGAISILGIDPSRDIYALQSRIGVQLQQAQLQKRIKVWEALDLWASLYPMAVDGNRLLEQLGLADKRNAWFMTLSGGQKQRLFIALALINDPEVVFLDELTTGLDPQARRAIWDLVRDIRKRGKTVFMTTHLMEEAERLCDRVAIIEHGRDLSLQCNTIHAPRDGAAQIPGNALRLHTCSLSTVAGCPIVNRE